MPAKALFLLTAVVALSAACEQAAAEGETDGDAAAVDAAGRVMVTMLRFEEAEPGAGAYSTRMLVSERYIRIDDGPGAVDYILYDNREKRIFSVLAARRQVLVVEPGRDYQPPPPDLALRQEKVMDENIPAAADYYRFYADEVLCYHVVTKAGFLPAVATIMRDYHRVLSAQQQQISHATPAALRTPCYKANYLYAPATYMSRGFPIQQWDQAGYRRALEAYEEGVLVDAALFTVPPSYHRYSLEAAVGR